MVHRDGFGEHAQRDLLGRGPTNVQANRNPHARELVRGDAFLQEKLEQRFPPPAAPQHAHVRGVAGQDRPQHGKVILVVVGQQDHERVRA